MRRFLCEADEEETRINEYINNIKLNSSRQSVITEHVLQYNNSFDWKNVRIMDTESNYIKRLISENHTAQI